MILKSLKYSEFKNQPHAWYLDEFTLSQVNLIVGKNASGKTRSLNIIRGVANLVSGEYLDQSQGVRRLPIGAGDFEFSFDSKGKTARYVLGLEHSKIYREEFSVDEKKYVKRKREGKGEIYYVREKKDISFQIPDTELAVVARRDAIQHPFLEDLYLWGKNTLHYEFGSEMGKRNLALFGKAKEAVDPNPKETEKVAAFMKSGLKQYGSPFKNKILRDMETIGYDIDDVGLEPMRNMMAVGVDAHPEGIFVKETDLQHRTYQHQLSQGMFRALSLIIQLNFAEFARLPSSILIDDIGEGLDFERSSKLIRLLIGKVRQSGVQLIMTTNDRFVMNNVPLEHWSVLTREGGHCKILNYQNSKKLFDEFEFTGLNNFDFFSSNFYSTN